MQKIVEKYLLPLAMVLGIVLHKYIAKLSPLTPILLAIMLFFTYSRISLKDIKLNKLHIWLLVIQYVASATIYFVLKPFNETLAQAAMICILAPTATSAPVVVGILGGNIASITTFALISNLSLAFLAPLFLSFVGDTSGNTSLITSAMYIFRKVVPILILPFVVAILIQITSPKIHSKVKSMKKISFYIWAVALTIVIGNVTNFIMIKETNNHTVEILIGAASLLICLLQFGIGRSIGSKFGQTITGGQGMGQKNTILAIWLTQTYLNPIASLGPGLYVAWQNIVNSYQIWIKSQSK